MAVVMRPRIMRSTSKMRNRKVEYDGYLFDSVKEMERYRDLSLAQRSGDIKLLIVHPQFDITIHGIHICKYVADFSYLSPVTNVRIVEDVKGRESGVPYSFFKTKKNLMKAIYGIEVREI
jgi:hypothetical protein